MSKEIKYVDPRLTREEILYIAKACRLLPENEKNEAIINSLLPKLQKLNRFAGYRELFGDLD